MYIFSLSLVCANRRYDRKWCLDVVEERLGGQINLSLQRCEDRTRDWGLIW
jgi:hypothetical protein